MKDIKQFKINKTPYIVRRNGFYNINLYSELPCDEGKANSGIQFGGENLLFKRHRKAHMKSVIEHIVLTSFLLALLALSVYTYS